MTSEPFRGQRMPRYSAQVECAAEGCTAKVKTAGLCLMHYKRLRRHGELSPPPRTRNKITDDVRAEIVRGMRRFESPLRLAKRLGVGEQTVRDVMRAERAS